MQTIKKISYTLLFVLTLTLISVSPAFAYEKIYFDNVYRVYHFGTSSVENFDSEGSFDSDSYPLQLYGTVDPSLVPFTSGTVGMFEQGVHFLAGAESSNYWMGNFSATSTATCNDLDVSLSVWVKTTTTNPVAIAQCRGNNSGHGKAYWIEWDGTNVEFWRNETGIGNIKAEYATNIADGNWHLLTLTYDQSYIRGFTDGALRTSSADTVETSSGISPNYLLGANVDNSTSSNAYDNSPYKAFSGFIDDFVVFNTYLQESEVLDIWNGGAGKEICLTVGCDTTSSPSSATLTWVRPNAEVVGNSYNIATYNYTNLPTSTYTLISVNAIISTSSDYSNPITSESITGYTSAYLWPKNCTECAGAWSGTTFYNNITTTTKVYGTLQLIGYDSVGTGHVIASATSSWWFFDSNEGFTSSTLSGIEALLAPESCADVGFFSSSTLSQIGCEFRNAVRFTTGFVFVPHSLFSNIIKDATNEFKRTFPFVFVFGTGDLIREKIASASSTALDIQIQLSGNSKSATTTIVLFSSSTMTNGFGSNFVNAYSNFVLTSLATVMVVGMIVLIGL